MSKKPTKKSLYEHKYRSYGDLLNELLYDEEIKEITKTWKALMKFYEYKHMQEEKRRYKRTATGIYNSLMRFIVKPFGWGEKPDYVIDSTVKSVDELALDWLLNASQKELLKIKGIGEKSWEFIIEIRYASKKKGGKKKNG